jgi:prepilin-type N-terminal cleavage/methylation domain-containing protein
MQTKARRGFTLPEVLVTVTVVAVLAAVVVPAVTQFASRGNTPATLTDLNAVRSGATSFVADTRTNPQTLYDLTVSSAPSYVPDPTTFHGPYLPATVNGNTSTGYILSSGLNIQIGGATGAITKSNGYLVTPIVMATNATCQDLWNLDKAFDGSDASISDAGTMATQGSLTWTGGCAVNGGNTGTSAATALASGATITLRLVSIGV